MDNKKNLVVFPYNIEFAPVIRYQELLEDYKITDLISPEGWGFIGKDACDIDRSEKIGIQIKKNFSKALENADTVLFCESIYDYDYEKVIFPKIVEAIERKKNVIFTLNLDIEKINEIKKLSQKNDVGFRYLGYLEKYEFENLRIMESGQNYRRDINIPIILVQGIAERSNKFFVQLYLREKILNMGYKLCQIGTRNYCELMGFYSFPHFMYSKLISEEEKVLLFNHYIKMLEINEKPDVFIIGVPGGIMPFNNYFNNRFGLLAYEVGNAIKPDVSIMSLLYEDFTEEYFTRIFNSVKHKLGYKLDCYNVSNIRFDWDSSRKERKKIYMTLDSADVDKKIKEFKDLETPVYNVHSPDDREKIADFLIKKLVSFGEVEVI